MTLGPATWGPSGWKFIHFVALGYPSTPSSEQKQAYSNFFSSLHKVLPCSTCANNYEKNLSLLPLTNDILNDRDKLIKWTIDIHNIVNEELGKPKISYEEAIKNLQNTSYNNINSNNSKNNSNNKEIIYSMVIILLFLVIIAVVYKKI